MVFRFLTKIAKVLSTMKKKNSILQSDNFHKSNYWTTGKPQCGEACLVTDSQQEMLRQENEKAL